MEYLVIGLGGFLGANARYLVGSWTAHYCGVTFPYGTFLANISGSFLLGMLMAFLQGHPLVHLHYRLFFAVGFLGAYTTFSTFTFESLHLLQNGSAGLAFANICGSVVLGLLGVFLGFLLGSLVS
jgi:fluoride exporter